MCESSDSQFFRTTTEIQSGTDAFDESRFVRPPLTILGVKEILCSFRLVLEGKTGKEISKYGFFFPGLYLPVFGLNTEKYGPEKSPYLDTFHAE